MDMYTRMRVDTSLFFAILPLAIRRPKGIENRSVSMKMPNVNLSPDKSCWIVDKIVSMRLPPSRIDNRLIITYKSSPLRRSCMYQLALISCFL